MLSVNMVNHAFDPIRADPRFAAVIRKLNLDVARFTLPDGGRSQQETGSPRSPSASRPS